MRANLKDGLLYLSDLAKKRLAYNTINVQRPMLSDLLEDTDNTPFGRHELTRRFMRGLFNLNPLKPRYSVTWDPQVILDYLSISDGNDDMGLLALSCKVTSLMALSTLMRVSEIAGIDKKSIIFSEKAVEFSLSKPRKWQRSGTLATFKLNKVNFQVTDIMHRSLVYQEKISIKQVYCNFFACINLGRNIMPEWPRDVFLLKFLRLVPTSRKAFIW